MNDETKADKLRKLAEKIESNYADRHAIAEAVRLAADEIEAQGRQVEQLVKMLTDMKEAQGQPDADLVDTATDKPAEA